MKNADQVFALRRVDAGFSTNRTVDLGQQGRRNLHEAHAAAQDAGSKACKIANYAATERHNYVAALKAELQKLFT